ncbi:MAG: hypothetical protein FWC26_13890 [Fibromonadales bacterium]|nr:hypothetical protein [Fibromonadales bacterium]
MILNELGNQAYDEWKKLQKRYPWVTFDVFQIMPDHMHGIIEINRNVPMSTHVPMSTPTTMTAAAGATLAVAPAAQRCACPNLHANTNVGNVVANCGNNVADVGNVVADGANIAAKGATARVAPAGNVAYGGMTHGNVAYGNVANDAVTIGRIIGAYKSLVYQNCLEIANINNRVLGKLWQRNYYDDIIRDKIQYANIKKYIRDNPANYKKRRLNF